MGIHITGSGSYIPDTIERNEDFHQHTFLNSDGSVINSTNEIIVEKFKAITGIVERRYAEPHLVASDLGAFAAEKAINDANIDPETLDYIIVAHNFGDVKYKTIQSDTVPSLAARIKHTLRIKNPKCVAYDILFGCPGWIQGVIQAEAYIKAGMAKKCLVIGTETLSRVVDKHDRDSMIFSDGAGATVVEATNEEGGILNSEAMSFTYNEAQYLSFGSSNNKTLPEETRYIKMNGRKIYEFSLINVPKAMKECLDNSGKSINEVKKIFIHQANAKMDEAIVERFYKLYEMEPPKDVMPMCIQKLGNSSVATVPTLLDLVKNNKLKGFNLNKGDVIIFASVGAGMHVNAMVYKY